MKKITAIIALVFAIIMIVSVPVGASSPYQTYTYSVDKTPLYSPDAYTPEGTGTVTSADMGLETPLKDPTDLVVGKDGYIYIADSGNNRIVCLDRHYKVKFTLDTFVNKWGNPDRLSGPQGVFVTADTIYVCDTGNQRIVKFNLDGSFKQIIEAPSSELFEEGQTYKPTAIAVDQYGRLFVIAGVNQGLMFLTSEGEFIKFIGARTVSIDVWSAFWRRFQSKEQREEASASYVPTELNNVTITDDGFIYVTVSPTTDDKSSMLAAIEGKSKSGDYAPVKLLNASGEEIMRRNGFWPPSGEIDVVSDKEKEESEGRAGVAGGISNIIDCAVGPAKTWSIIDDERSKVFTYDFDGNLLFAFGDKGAQSGTQSGNLAKIKAIAYQGSNIILLDFQNANITVLRRTAYGDLLIDAIEAQNNRQFDQSLMYWTEILKKNSNFDTAYIGIGQALYRQGEYEDSLAYYMAAYDSSNYSVSYQQIRKEWMATYIIVIPIVVVAFVVLWGFFMKYAKKVNTAAAHRAGKKTFKEELLFAFHLIFHPFDGFWDLKHEKRGSIRASLVFIALTIIAFFYQSVGRGYLFNPMGEYSTIFGQAVSILLPFFMFVVANWCLTTLFDGEGSLKDIFIATSYSLVPIPIIMIIVTMLTNFVTVNEMDILNLVLTISYLWFGMLIFFGTMVTHDYPMGKNILTILGTLLVMICIMFIGVLFTTLLSKLVSFVTNIITEIQYRM